jgi:putative acetyltransferase
MPYHIVRRACFPEDLEAVRNLFVEYFGSLAIDLSFQNTQEELDSLPGKYSADLGGSLWLATSQDGEVIGTIAMRRWQAGTCELKRLYVRSSARGANLGLRLMRAIIADAKAQGYSRCIGDSLRSMKTAQGMLPYLKVRPYIARSSICQARLQRNRAILREPRRGRYVPRAHAEQGASVGF